MYCKNCGNQLPDGAAACVRCGFAVGTGNNHCANCGAQVTPGQAICVNCGAALVAPQSQPAPASPKTKVAAALLCFFLGGWGIHNFYLGHVAKGVIQLCLTLAGALTFGITTLGCGIWTLVEFIMILIGSYKDANGRTLS